MKNLILYNIIISLFFVVACNTDKPNIPIEEFRVPIVSKNINYFEPVYNYSSKISAVYWTNYLYEMYSYDKSDHYFYNTVLEIELNRYIFVVSDVQFDKPGFCKIGIRNINSIEKAFVICWVNIPLDSNLTRLSEYKIHFEEGINETTDTIYTTLSENSIKSLYPKFQGIYQYIQLDSISIDYHYKVQNSNFYNHIKFHDFHFK